MGGLMTLLGLAWHHGSKFALEGISESLGKEVRHLSLHVTAIAPGSFRTDWAGRSMVRSPRSLADYDGLMDPIRARRAAVSGNQAGDPARLARAVLTLVDVPGGGSGGQHALTPTQLRRLLPSGARLRRRAWRRGLLGAASRPGPPSSPPYRNATGRRRTEYPGPRGQ